MGASSLVWPLLNHIHVSEMVYELMEKPKEEVIKGMQAYPQTNIIYPKIRLYVPQPYIWRPRSLSIGPT